MQVGDLVKYHRAGKRPEAGLVFDIDERRDTYGYSVNYYCVKFSDTSLKLSEERLEVISSASR